MLSLKNPSQIRYRILIGCLAFASIACEWHLLAQTSQQNNSEPMVSNLKKVENRIRDELLSSKRYQSKRTVESKPDPAPLSSVSVDQRIRKQLLRQQKIQRLMQAVENQPPPQPLRTSAPAHQHPAPISKTARWDTAPIQGRPSSSLPLPTSEKSLPVSEAIDPTAHNFLQDSVDSLTLEAPTDTESQMQDLDSFVNYALANHPALAASTAKIQATQYEALQAGLAPNPQLGLYLDELGNDNDPGLWGAYIRRDVIRGNKRSIDREVKNREVNVREIKNEALTISITTEVKRSFYRVLIAQEKLELASQLYNAQQQAVSQSRQLFDSGETPKTDLLQTELQAQRAKVLLGESNVIHKNSWRKLAASIGSPTLQQHPLIGSFEPVNQPLLFDFWQHKILESSPELLAAKAEVERVRTTIDREIAQSIPDYQTQISLGRDSNSNHFFTGVQLQVPLQIYDRNQGNIAAAKSNLVASKNRVRQIELRLTKQLAIEFQQYEMALVKIDLYQSELLPNAETTLDLLKSGYPEEVSFLNLVTAQQTLIDLTIDYLNAIDELWKTRLKIEGLLLDNSLNS
jgi:cobalt-zinc-cadmium efflux system outer membrane protein